ncbi:DUF4007 family protein [Methylophilus sp. YYY-1]|uniref:DUF4007 family protein n=1 Tax=Methylophilus sp. YYY-1 TaxID=2682087 RepID=UPI0023B2178A|nr:DUF4007 family protein [Methylophilus sp. YYY-1]MDF0379001.1 DUF4007 family protein [Methylophilus sp. YYY-1]
MNSFDAKAGYDPHFSGHETFPLRQMWLKKVFDRSAENKVLKSEFTREEAIGVFGVGKNMVSSIKHWAMACGLLLEGKEVDSFTVSLLWSSILSSSGKDPYCEHPNTLWLAHWRLAGHHPGKHRSTTIWWIFNNLNAPMFNSNDLVKHLVTFSEKYKSKVSEVTLKRDVDTCLRGYCPKVDGNIEELAEPMLAELGLVINEGNGSFSIRRTLKPTLSDGMFLLALMEFWTSNFDEVATLSFEAIAHGINSPGRVFKMDEDSIAERLYSLEEITNGQLGWTDLAGIKQVTNVNHYTVELAQKAFLDSYDD